MAASIFKVIGPNNIAVHAGSKVECQEWMRRNNAGFFCRLIEVEGGTPLAQHLQACLSKIKREMSQGTQGQEQEDSANG